MISDHGKFTTSFSRVYQGVLTLCYRVAYGSKEGELTFEDSYSSVRNLRNCGIPLWITYKALLLYILSCGKRTEPPLATARTGFALFQGPCFRIFLPNWRIPFTVSVRRGRLSQGAELSLKPVPALPLCLARSIMALNLLPGVVTCFVFVVAR